MVTALAADLIESSAAAEAARLPLSTRFELGDELTPLQRAFLDKNGFCIFAGVAKQEELDAIYSEVCAIQERWLTERRKKVYGIPLFAGKDPEGRPFIQRFAFTSNYSELIREFVTDERFEPIRRLIGEDARVGHEEKDGVVFNRNLNVKGSAYPRLGWHTDGLRSLFYGRLPGPMLNVGLHFDRIKKEQGGLRRGPSLRVLGRFFLRLVARFYMQRAAVTRRLPAAAGGAGLDAPRRRVRQALADRVVSGKGFGHRLRGCVLGVANLVCMTRMV